MVWRFSLICITLSYFVSLLIYQRGLLLKRRVITTRSICTDALLTSSKSCWMPVRFNRTVILLIDALRYDFIKPTDLDWKSNSNNIYYRNQMPFSSQLLKNSQTVKPNISSAHLFKFISDAPTTTFQRIKALVTGNIPTFIEAGDNFVASEITEDNFVDQLISVGKNVTFLGDDTWTQILPNRFHREFSLPSFDIKDLESVDNLVIEKIYDELRRPDWSLIIAHVLGVDHCGHRYGPSHSEMRRKLRQMDELILNITKIISDDTLFLVMGDHGMTINGDHGGESRLEVEAALFVYAKNYKFFNGKISETINQIDLVPTLSLLLGLPIPFSNLGLIIDSLINVEDLSRTLKLNAVQILRYAQEYSQFEINMLPSLWSILQEYEAAPYDYDSELNRRVIKETQSILRTSFITVDLQLTYVGILSFIEAILFNIYVFFIFDAKLKIYKISAAQYVFRSALYFLQFALYFGGGANVFTKRSGQFNDLLIFNVMTLLASIFYIIINLFVYFILGYNFQSFWRTKNTFNYLRYLFFIIFIVQAISFCSNSYIIYESIVLRCFLQLFLFTILLNYLYKNRIQTRNLSKFSLIKIPILRNLFWRYENVYGTIEILFCMLLVRLTAIFETCREEHVKCVNTLYYADNEGYAIFICFSAFCLLILNKKLIQHRLKFLVALKRNYKMNDILILSNKLTAAISWPMCFCVLIHWFCDFSIEYLATQNLSQPFRNIKNSTTINNNNNNNLIIYNFNIGSQQIAQIVYFFAFLHIILFIPFLIFRTTQSNIAYFKTHWQLIIIVLSMIIGKKLTPIFCFIVFIYLTINKYFQEKDLFFRTLFKYLLGSLTFYALSHQCILTLIPWDAAFVGLPGNFKYKIVAAVLVIINLFLGNFLSIANIFYTSIWNKLTNQINIDFLRSEIFIFIAFNALRVLSSCIAGIMLHKNLMFFKIFAPKFVFEAVNLLFCCLIATFYALFLPLNIY